MNKTLMLRKSVICGKKYTNKDIRVRDHCHITGQYRGSAHEEYNLKLRISSKNSSYQLFFIISGGMIPIL